MIDRLKIIVLEPNPSRRKQICTWISEDGYSTYECRDPFKLMRMIHQIKPDFVIMNFNLNGVSMLQTAKYIEKEQGAQVVFLKDGQLVGDFSHFLVIGLPIKKSVFIQTLEFAKHIYLKQKELESQIKQLQKHIARDPIIDDAKKYLMNKWNISDEEAYGILRKRSMNESKPIELVSKEIISKIK